MIYIAIAAVVALFVVLHLSYESRLRTQREAFDKERAALQQQLDSERAMAGDRFKALATDVLQANSRQLGDVSVQQMLSALAPVKESIDEFRRSYRQCYDTESRDRISLREEIRSLHSLNTRVGDETARLANALRGNNGVQGRWGEMILVNILEHSGLQRGRWFVTQESTTTDDGSRLRPDAIIHCPDNRDIIIDSKTNITHYLRAMEAPTDEQREALLKEHVQSVEKQVAALSRKEYQNNVGAGNGEFVIMFMPHEGAFISAMNSRPALWEQAYDKKVIIASPTHLVTVVRLVERMWHNDDTNVNAQKIAATATTLLGSISSMMADLETLGKTLDKAVQQHASVAKRLATGNNNILRVAERLKELGVRN